MLNITDRLFELSDEKYAAFQSKLTPGIPREAFIGVRIPVVRKLAKEILGKPETDAFLDSLPHKYYDENILHGTLVSGIKDYDVCMKRMEEFLPYIDNWAVCDTTSPKVFAKNKDRLIPKIREWIDSDRTYTCRFGIEMLMRHFLDDDFAPSYLEWPAGVSSEEYYVKMMVAWFFATALAKQWDAAVPYIENRRLEPRTLNMTVQKAVESYRITDEQKAYLRQFKIKD